MLLTSSHRPAACVPISHSFTLLSDPAHVFHRDFKYVNSSAASRLAFIRLFRRVFLAPHCSTLSAETAAPLGPEALHQLCCLICTDFPFSLVRNAARITNDPVGAGGNATAVAAVAAAAVGVEMSLAEFAHKLFVLLYYSEFLNQCALAFRAIDTAGTGRVARSEYARRLRGVLQSRGGDFSCPPATAIDDALLLLPASSAAATNGDSADEGVMFNSFCVDLFSHALIRRSLEQ